MKNLEQEGSFKLPSLSLNANSGVLELAGKSIPERTSEFYDPVLAWIDEYSQSPQEETIFNVKLEYCNSSSTRYLMDILERLERIFKEGKKVTVNWYYEEDDEDMLDLGQSYSVPLTIPINMILVPVD
ncbi:MAG TPA: DUF1987 domain-containing protein [Flavobacteriales bacterium]|nr:DUF1987 domain-containing protein [Flavobacteriales bacterium]HIO68800.1 DUF1987 domain-containing protein [Flavobacteriales bacterium]